MNLKSAIQVRNPESSDTPSKVLRLSETPRSSEATQAKTEPSVGSLSAAMVVDWNGQNNAVTLRFGSVDVTAALHPSVDPAILRRAIERGELAIAQQQPEGLQVIGVLRTSATPGVDVGDDYVIEARRVTLRAEHELVLTSGAARLALAAVGRIESIARHITARASIVHKIIGRVIQLN